LPIEILFTKSSNCPASIENTQGSSVVILAETEQNNCFRVKLFACPFRAKFAENPGCDGRQQGAPAYRQYIKCVQNGLVLLTDSVWRRHSLLFFFDKSPLSKDGVWDS
jgi:hypothetical protein